MAMPLTHRRFTVDEYHRMAEAGILTEDDRVELLDGQIVPMTPIGHTHSGCVNRLTRLFSALGGSVTVSIQNPVVLEPHDEPQPDVAVLRYRQDGYAHRHPGPQDVLLLIEVAESPSAYDRPVKVPRYARARIAEAWLVNLPENRIEVFRDPGPVGYASVRHAFRGENLTPLLLPDLEIPVADVLG